jgi:hypothetical protein
VAAATLVLVGLMQVGVGLQVDRVGPIVGGVLLLVVAVALAVGRGKRTVVGHGGIHAPRRMRQRELPWSTIEALQIRPHAGGRVQVLVVREGHPPEAALPVATLRAADADEHLPAVRALAEAHGVPVHEVT